MAQSEHLILPDGQIGRQMEAHSSKLQELASRDSRETEVVRPANREQEVYGQIGNIPRCDAEEPFLLSLSKRQSKSDDVSAALATGLRPVPLLRVSSFLRQSYPPPLLSPLGQKKEKAKPNGDASTRLFISVSHCTNSTPSTTLTTMKGEILKLRSLLNETTSYLQQRIEEQQRQQRLLAKEKDSLLRALEREKLQHAKVSSINN